MPFVPNVPGVPPLTSYSAQTAVLLFADALIFAFQSLFPRWGIFRNGIAVIDFDSMLTFELKQDFPISDYPVEGGGFQSYNKVQLPTDIRVSVAAGGSESRRQSFLDSIDAVMNTTDLYDIVTPEQVYLSYCFAHRDFRRSSKNGVGLITVDLWLTEIRVSAQASFQQTQQPAEAGQQGTGNVQPQAISPNISIRPTPPAQEVQ